MKFIYIIVLTLSINLTSSAQNDECQCQLAFDDLVEKIESNYIVLAQMRLDGTSSTYDARVKKYKQESTLVEGEDCTAFLKDFLKYFKDGHLFVFQSPTYTEEELINKKNKIKASKANLNHIDKALSDQMNVPDDLIGKWRDTYSDIAIIKEGEYYNAYILNSEKEDINPGELKAKFKRVARGFEGTYYSYNYASRYVEGDVFKDGNLLKIVGIATWLKMETMTEGEIASINKEDVNLPVVQKLDDKHTLLSIPSFAIDYKLFNSILKENESLLKNTTNLIIDIRGNTGGNGIYLELIKLYANRSRKPSQGKVLASEANFKYFERFAENAKKIYGPVAEGIKNNMGRIVDGPRFPGQNYKKSKSKIEHVAILTDKACMSAAESFILHSKQASTLVQTFGNPTRGVIDYTSVNVLKIESGKENILFGYPTGTWHPEVFPKNGYNKNGIAPDIPIQNEVADKIQYIMDYYAKEK